MKSKKQNLVLFCSGVFCLSFTFGIHFSVFNNFAVEHIGLQPQHLGILESIREVPGLLGVLIGGLLARFPDTRVAGISLILFGAGFIGYSQIASVPLLILFSFLWSVGFHTWYPLADGINLRLSETHERGRRLGQVRSVGAVATMLGIGTVYLLAKPLGYDVMYVVAGIVGAAGAIGLIAMDREAGHHTLGRFVFKRRYGLFYTLHLLDGCRRQIFSTFAVFTLVRVYHVDVRQVAVLALVNSGLSFVFGPYIGRFIDRFGERTALTINYVEMGIVFLGFATLHTVGVLCALYVVDSFFFLLSMSLNTYISKIAEPGDLRPSLSMAVTMNHIAAVVMPLVGGYLWMRTGYETIFSMGVGLSVIALVVTQRMRVHPPKPVTGHESQVAG